MCCIAFQTIYSGCTPIQSWFHSQNKDMSRTQQPLKPVAKKIPKPKLYHHTIRWPGENLSIISRWYTGSANNWKIIAKTNPNLNTKSLKIGSIVMIPANIVSRPNTMPRDFLKKNTRNPKKNERPLLRAPSNKKKQRMTPFANKTKRNANKKQDKITVDDLKLFGPID